MKTIYWIALISVTTIIVYYFGLSDGWMGRVNYEARMCIENGYLCPR